VFPALAGMKGFKGFYLLIEPVTGKGIQIDLWETESDAKAAETNGTMQDAISKLLPLLPEPPTMELFQVVAQV
jgi:hypothetical protein